MTTAHDDPIRTALSQGPCSSLPRLAARYLGEYHEKIRTLVTLLDDEQVWWRPAQGNSIGNLLLHLAGNLSLWIGQGLGGVAYERDRWGELTAERTATGTELLARLAAVVERCQAVLAAQEGRPLDERVDIQGYEIDRLGAIFHPVEHMSYHTGQIVWIAKHLIGPAREVELYPRHRGE